MADEYSVPVAYNKTSTAFDHLWGAIGKFPNRNVATGGLYDQGVVTCIWVRNASSGTLAKNTICEFTSAYARQKISGVIGSYGFPGIIVPEWYGSTGVPDGSNFWGIISGPCTFISNGATTLARKDKLVGATGGKVCIQVAAPADATAAMIQVNAYAGSVEDATVTNVDATTFRGWFSSAAFR